MTRTQLEITLGIIFVLVTSTIVIFYGLNEENRMAEFEDGQRARAIEAGAGLFENQCSRCHGTQGLGIPGLCPPLNDRYFFDQRLDEVGWSGTLEDYIVATASGGRLASTRPNQYAGAGVPAMPAFSERFGGPLRDDQIRNIAAYIANWEPTAGEVQAAAPPSGPTVGSDITQELPDGSAADGETLASTQGCVACHVSSDTGPAWMPSADMPGIGERAAARIEQADYTGSATTPEQYLLESIVQPGTFVVEGYQNIMPGNYGTSLTSQDAADLIAYLQTLK
ncbi:MAG: cytochrome c [Anaerolineales bacterium]|jgi:mono/diheme cytochrome c family protein